MNKTIKFVVPAAVLACFVPTWIGFPVFVAAILVAGHTKHGAA